MHVAHAVSEAEEYIATHGGLDDTLLDQMAVDVCIRGPTPVICDAQQRLRDPGTVLKPESA